MIIWIASYPKSGNTWVRALLSTYLNPQKKTPFEGLEEIARFPNIQQFKDIIDLDLLKKDKLGICRYWIDAQQLINLKQDTTILKTHNFGGSIGKYQFTDKENTSGVIYIIRDPRSVAVSYAHHNNISFDSAIDRMLNVNMISHNSEYINEVRTSWKIHYLSWKKSQYPKIIIKYEDLYTDSFFNFKKILKFVSNIKDVHIDDQKIKTTIKKCSFDNLSNLEKTIGFSEKNEGVFFRSGKIDEWKSKLSIDQIKKIENGFSEEMKDLNYL